ncbi:hypothetical protein SteCoe_33955 [Stentor coeruleus]|uniref:PPM-type phosphatase domain-containing protein n=1 Tax=Stentor coeruleus TaxID=5963 RepID=A0A1R2AVX9_9CILI|nr:hypothetical protein SteCoe_33955 [Stentor coeruleus]
MGNCCKPLPREYPGDRVFSKKVSINIKCKNYTEKVNFVLPQAEILTSSTFAIKKLDISMSACCLPGIDPRGLIKKQCQDTLFIKQKDDSILVGVFDGHGKHGREIVKFCSDFMVNYFDNNFSSTSPKEFLTSMTEECDKVLLNESNINCSTSGTTAVVLLINPTSIWTCSVGDSRAILGTLPKHQKPIENKIISETLSYKRPVVVSNILKAVQITLDQKPNISYELARILKSGGVVQQLSNSEGKKIGPYRIWKPNGKVPGLAMSRSLGDSIAKSIGVISKPVIHQLEICYPRDQFIILATDGIWDAMNNTEAINFVEKYRKNSSSISLQTKPVVTNTNSTIAEFLCEESRYRWLGICSDEDVAIDDITALVLEIKPHNISNCPIIQRKGVTTEQSFDIEDNQEHTYEIQERFDIHRGSNAVIEETNEEDEEDEESKEG